MVKNKDIVLMFHDVVNSKFPISGFQTIGSAQYQISDKIFENIVNKSLLAKDNVIFSFDDGGSSFYYIVAPILENVSKKGIFFITTSQIGKSGFLLSDQIKELYQRGHIIASHSHTHPRDISKLSFQGIVEEWIQSKAILEEIINAPVTVASIPGGAVSKQVLKAMEMAGYTEIYTSKPTTVTYQIGNSTVFGRFTINSSFTDVLFEKLIYDKVWQRKLLYRYKLLHIFKFVLGSNYNKFKLFFLKYKSLFKNI